MSHVFFMLVPIVLIAASVMQLIDATDRNIRLTWTTVLVVASTVLILHSATMHILIHLN